MRAREADPPVPVAALFPWLVAAVSVFAGISGCASTPRTPSTPSSSGNTRQASALPTTAQLAVPSDERPQPDPSDSLDPEFEKLLTAQRSPDDAGAQPTPTRDADSPCPPGRPDTPAERSLCICERICASTVDRQAIARRRLAAGADPETIQRWLDEASPGSIHYPYVEIDGLRIDFAGDGRVLRGRHSVLREPSSDQTLECRSPADTGEAVSSVSAPPRSGS